MSLDVLVRGAVWQGRRINIAVADQVFAGLGPEIDGDAKVIIEADNLAFFPGVIDPHVHFNEPGRTEWEGFATGSRAFAAGGGTLFFDMPLNAAPPTTTPEAFDMKRAAAEASSVTDFALWGGITPHNLDQVEALAERGVIGFKAFLSPSGMEDFDHVSFAQLERAMRRSAPTGLVVGVHAEDPAFLREGRGTEPWQRFADSRPPEAELSAVRAVIEIAGATRCAAHIVHVSLPETLELIAAAKSAGVNISAEVCAHHLLLSEEAMGKLGALAKCAPPLRSRETVDKLWSKLHLVTNLASDHSPSTPEMKSSVSFEHAWGGVSGIQHGFSRVLDEFVNRGWNLEKLSDLVSSGSARRFGLPLNKGAIQPGADADFCLIDRSRDEPIEKESLQDRHRHSPYVGQRLRSRITHTVRRGELLVNNGLPVANAGRGRWIHPDKL